MDKNFLGVFLTEYGQLKVEKRKIEKQIENSDITRVMNEKEAKIRKISIDISDLNVKKKHAEQALDKLHLDFVAEEVSERIKKLTSVVPLIKFN